MRSPRLRFGHGIAVCSAAVTRFLLHKSLCILFALLAAAPARAGRPIALNTGSRCRKASIPALTASSPSAGLDGGERSTWLLGRSDKPSMQSRFEIGALTEIFTGLLFAQAVIDGKLGQHATLRDTMPHQTFADPRMAGLALDALASHRAPLPAMPPNLFPADIDDLFASVDRQGRFGFPRQLPHAGSVAALFAARCGRARRRCRPRLRCRVRRRAEGKNPRAARHVEHGIR